MLKTKGLDYFEVSSLCLPRLKLLLESSFVYIKINYFYVTTLWLLLLPNTDYLHQVEYNVYLGVAYFNYYLLCLLWGFFFSLSALISLLWGSFPSSTIVLTIVWWVFTLSALVVTDGLATLRIHRSVSFDISYFEELSPCLILLIWGICCLLTLVLTTFLLW